MQRNEIEERMNIDNEPQNTKNPFIKKKFSNNNCFRK